MVRVTFVCLGNICRSPTAQAVMRHLIREQGLENEIQLDSAGTGEWHVGEARDPRSSAVGQRRGMPLYGRARQFQPEDFARFDYVLASGRVVCVLQILDDCSRFDLALRAVRSENAVDVWAAVVWASSRYGLPARFLTDNGRAFSGARRGWASAGAK